VSGRLTPTRKSSASQTKARAQPALKRPAGCAAIAQRLQRQMGNQATQHLLQAMRSPRASVQRQEMGEKELLEERYTTPTVRTKLQLGRPGDAYEREADEVADQIMRMPATETVQGACEACRAKKRDTRPRLDRWQNTTGMGESALDAQVQRAVAGGGKPLSSSARSFFEPHLGYDLSPVRVHTDTRAAEATRALGAVAFTLGRDVAFDTGQYAPDTDLGRHLLAHELTHVVQQGAGGGNSAQKKRVERTLAEPRLQARWGLDSAVAYSGVDANYGSGNSKTFMLSLNPPGPGFANATGTAQTWQTTGIVHQQEGGEAHLAHWVTKHFIFKNEGDTNDMLQLTAIGQLAGNAKAEDLRYALAGSAVYAQVIERTPEDPSPGAEQLFEIHNGGISTASTREIGEIEGNIPVGEGSVNIRIPLKKKDEGEFSPFSKSSTTPKTIDASVSEVDVILGARMEAASDIETAYTGVAPWLSRNYNESSAWGQFSLFWWNRPAPVAPAPPGASATYWCNAKCQEQCPDGVRGYLHGRSTENCSEATKDAKSKASRDCYPRHCSCRDSTGFRGTGEECEKHKR
jgi:Domain of unknown function (DUF4157)